MVLVFLIGALLCGALGFGPRVQAASQEKCPVCPPGWTVYEGRCYIFIRRKTDWINAELTCLSHGGHLASMHNPRLQHFIQKIIYTATDDHVKTWIGGHDRVKEGKWLWSDGSKFTFLGWAKGEPNNKWGREHCMEFDFRRNYANDENCSSRRSYICAMDLNSTYKEPFP